MVGLLFLLVFITILLPFKVVSRDVAVPFVYIIFDYLAPKITKTAIGNIIIGDNILWRYKYNHSDKSLTIGCINMSLPEWSYFFSKECKEVYSTPRNTFRFWLLRQRYKQMLKLIKHGQL